MAYFHDSRRTISGAGLSQLRRRMTAVERAVLAAEIIDGRVILQGLTTRTVADLTGSNLAYVHAALSLSVNEREQVLNGTRSLIEPAEVRSRPPMDWARFGQLELVEAVKQIGVDRVLDAAVAAE